MFSILLLTLFFLILTGLTFLNKKLGLKKGNLLKKWAFAWSAITVLYVLVGFIKLICWLPVNIVVIFSSFLIPITLLSLNKYCCWGKGAFFRYLTMIWMILVCLIVATKTVYSVHHNIDSFSEKSAAKVTHKMAVKKADNTLEETAARLETYWQTTLKNFQTTDVDIALYSKKDNHTYKFTQHPQDIPFYTASIIKVAILAQILHLEQNNQLIETPQDHSLEEAMIEHSNNDATTYLLTKKLTAIVVQAPYSKL